MWGKVDSGHLLQHETKQPLRNNKAALSLMWIKYFSPAKTFGISCAQHGFMSVFLLVSPFFFFFFNSVLVCLESNASKTKCKGTASCSRTRGRQSTRTRTSGHQCAQGNLCTASLNMGTKGNLHRCTSFAMFYNIATIKSTTSGKQWRGGRQRAELVEGHSVTVGSQPRRSEEMDTQCFYSQKDLGTSKLGI